MHPVSHAYRPQLRVVRSFEMDEYVKTKSHRKYIPRDLGEVIRRSVPGFEINSPCGVPRRFDEAAKMEEQRPGKGQENPCCSTHMTPWQNVAE